MSQTETIRNGFVTALSSLKAENGGPLGQLSAYPLANMEPPVIYIDAGEITYDLAMGRGEDKLNFIIVALFPFSGPDVSSQEALDNMRDGSGSLSIKALVEADRTLGGACTSLRVTTLSRPSMYESPGHPARIGCEWTVEVYR